MRKLGFQELPKDNSTKRFGGAIDDYGLQKHMPSCIPKNTVRETEWAVRIWPSWATARNGTRRTTRCDPQRQLVEQK